MSATVNSELVSIENVGPIANISFQLPKDSGGAIICRGHNGAGKTHVINAIAALFGDDGAAAELTPRDGEERGEIEGLGRKLSIGKRKKSTGAATVQVIKADLGELINPQVKDAKARVKSRVRVLAQLGGTKLTPQQLLKNNDDLIALVDIDAAADCDDPVAMADVLKRALDREALEIEKSATTKETQANARLQDAGNVDELKDVSIETLAEKHRAAMQVAESVRSRNSAYLKSVEVNAEVAKQVKEMTKPAVDRAKNSKRALDIDIEINELEQKLHALKEEKQNVTAFTNAWKRYDEDKKRLESLTMQAEPVRDGELEKAEQEAETAYQKLMSAQEIGRRITARDVGKALHNEAVELVAKATKIREAAKSIHEEVQKALPIGRIQIHDGDLVVQYARRKKAVPFDTLSEGERVDIALEYAIKAGGEGCLLTINQEAWQSLSPEWRRKAADLCESRKVWLISAEVADGELEVSKY